MLAIPRFWWFTLASLVAMTACVSVVVLGARVMQNGYGCLYLDGEDVTMLDTTSGRTFRAATWTPEAKPTGNDPYVFSPDRKSLAFFKATGPRALTVEHSNTPIPTNKAFTFFSINALSVEDILWSPTGRLIAYHWREGTGTDTRHYVAIADANGKMIQQTKLEVDISNLLELDSWSPDENYIALLKGGNPTRSMIFLSVPELQLVDGSENGYRVGSGCGFSGYGHLDCHPWAANGHIAAYTATNDSGKAHLIIKVPGETNQQSFDLPDSTHHTVQWSRNSDFVAVGSFNLRTDYSGKEARIDIFGVDGKVYPNIGRAVEANLYVSDTTIYAEMQWSPDGKSLYYARLNSTDETQDDIMRYQVDTGQTKVLLTAPSAGPTETFFYIAPDSQTAAFYLRNGDLYIVSIDGNVLAHFETRYLSADNLVWSPDSSAMVYPTYDSQAYTEILTVISTTGKRLGRFPERSFTRGVTWTQCNMP